MYNYVKTGLFESNIPVVGAYDSGFAEGMGPVPGLTTLGGYSDEDGILDTNEVTLGIAWDFSWNYSTTVPECGTSSAIIGIPNDGGKAVGICKLY
jgi:hypothetical protein